MEALCNKDENFHKKRDGFRSCGAKNKSINGSSLGSRETSSSGSCSSHSTEKVKTAKGSSSPTPLGWPIRKAAVSKCSKSDEKENHHSQLDSDGTKFTTIRSKVSGKFVGTEIDMMKERFAKLLLGEDMSGSGKGVCTAMAISNAITNLCATVFGKLWRLEPLPCEKKEMWRREMDWLLCVSDHIVELIPSWQTFPDGSKLEVMTCRPRSDIFINLPALHKLDNMLLEILDSFTATDFWYVDQGIVAPEADGSASFRRRIQRQEEKWWLPVPRVPPAGLSDKSRIQLNHTRECTNQILKAAMAINSTALAEMEVPESYLEALPKNGRTCLGDFIYRYITSDQFSHECLLDCLDLSSEHVALEIANRVEASIYVWRRRAHSRAPPNANRSTTKSSWEMVKDFMADGDKRELLAERAENILLSLKQRFPDLTQTTLDTSKIQCNKDVGKSILESYSRVLESMAFNIVARIDDLLYVDDLTKHSDRFPLVPKVNMVSQQIVSHSIAVSVSGTPHKPAVITPRFSPAPLISPARGGDRTPFSTTNNNIVVVKPQHRRGFGVRRVLSNYLGVETKTTKIFTNSTEVNCSNTSNNKVQLPELKKEPHAMKNKTK
ncbi:hypothetical protein Lal_00030754 [Lupinus albus]|uniref:Putative PRONE domain-containing protein n=1 Tax=Lupinus albus TaxID=3870 RepID=A0A6A4NR27_LUPAL|nr:putative PRONE domain-containing protein [Lupinus albus]KAF1863676.1 hypothetical protein Lal_00030754 [Lupinus albus]